MRRIMVTRRCCRRLWADGRRMLTEIRDRKRLRARLRQEGAWAAYALADLQPGLFEQSRWYVAESGGLVLEYCGFTPHTLMGFGTTKQLRPLVAGLPPGSYALSWPWPR